MNKAITFELEFFLISILWGAIILLVYDGFRIFRRLIKHNEIFLATEDLIFWVAASVFIFAMMYQQNNGIIRGFSVMGMAIGMILYHYILSELIVSMITKLLNTLFRPITFAIKQIKRMLLFIRAKFKKLSNFLLLRLKKTAKSVRIILNKQQKKSTVKRELKREKNMEEKKKQSQRKLAEKKRKEEQDNQKIKMDPNKKPKKQVDEKKPKKMSK